MAFEVNWSASSYSQLKDHVLYQKWSVKPMSSVIAGKADLITDIGKVIMNRDSVLIVDYL